MEPRLLAEVLTAKDIANEEAGQMADDKTKRGGQDRARVAGGQDHEVEHFASTHGISTEDARALIAKHGNDRDALNAAAKRLKRS